MHAAQAAFAHAMLTDAGATIHGAWKLHAGRSVRIVNGAGRGLADVQATYREPPSVVQSEIIVCAGALDLGVPAALIATGRDKSVVRPDSADQACWYTLDQAREEFGL